MEGIIESLRRQFPEEDFDCQMDDRRIVYLTGRCSSWQRYIDIGHAAAAFDFVRNVVNDIRVDGVEISQKDYASIVKQGKKAGIIDVADVVIIGAGISGCAIARELAAWKLKIIVVDAGEDVACGASRANSGCIHHGMDCKPGTLKSKLNVLGNRRYDDWERELHIHFVRCGCLEYVTDMKDLPVLYERFETGIKNGVDGICVINRDRAYELEPSLKSEGVPVIAALYMPSHGVVETPYVCIALAENAAENGVRFMFDCAVGAVNIEDGKIQGVVTERGIIRTQYIVNAAGIYADDIARMAGDCFYTMHNRKGTLAVMDKGQVPTYKTMVANLSLKDKHNKVRDSKGGGSNRTPEDNLMVGPSSTEVADKDDVETTLEGLDYILEKCMSDPNKSSKDIIRIFAGARPADFKEDFIVEMSEKVEGFVHVAGIQSPGVASAPAIADRVVSMITTDIRKRGEIPCPNDGYNPVRQSPVAFRHLSREEQDQLIKKDPRYGNIICRCEQVTEGEIVAAIHSPLQPKSINAIKNRTRAGMGRCQGGFCQPRVLEILARELHKDFTEIGLKGRDSNILLCDNRSGQEVVRDDKEDL